MKANIEETLCRKRMVIAISAGHSCGVPLLQDWRAQTLIPYAGWSCFRSSARLPCSSIGFSLQHTLSMLGPGPWLLGLVVRRPRGGGGRLWFVESGRGPYRGGDWPPKDAANERAMEQSSREPVFCWWGLRWLVLALFGVCFVPTGFIGPSPGRLYQKQFGP